MIISQQVLAQMMVDSMMVEQTTVDWYDKQVGRHNSILQYGELADLTRKSLNSHPYYGNDKWVLTNLVYYGQTFNNVYALFDIEQDILIVRNNLGTRIEANPIKLRKDGISSFTIGSEKFEQLDDKLSWQHQGFFKVVYKGDSLVLLCKIFKDLEFESRSLTYKDYNHYFLKRENKYYRLKRLSQLLKIYPQFKKEIRQQKKLLKLRKLDNPINENKLGQLIEFCETLNRK